MVANNNLLWTFAITALLGSGSGFIAWSLNGPRFLFWKFILAVLAIVLVVISLFSLLDWVAIEVGRVRYTLAMRETLSPSLRRTSSIHGSLRWRAPTRSRRPADVLTSAATATTR